MTKKTKRNVIISASSTIAVCLGLIAGGTYAWFTDKADVSVNKVVSGTLDVTMKMRNNPDEEWVDAEGQTLHFLRAGDDRKLVDTENDDPVLWEPGATYKLPQLQIVNQGSLAFQYKVVRRYRASRCNQIQIRGDERRRHYVQRVERARRRSDLRRQYSSRKDV